MSLQTIEQKLTLKLRRKTGSELNNYTPKEGEPVLNTDTGEIRCGDGVNVWVNLPSQVQKLTTQRSINGIYFDGTGNISNYFTCTTASNTPIKYLTSRNSNQTINVTDGLRITVRFTNPVSTDSISFNINNIEYGVCHNGSYVGLNYLTNNKHVYEFIYDSTVKYTGVAGAEITGGFVLLDHELKLKSTTENNILSLNSIGELGCNLTLEYDDDYKSETDSDGDEVNDVANGVSKTEKVPYILLKADGNVIGEISAKPFLMDSVLQDVTFNSSTSNLVFTWSIDSDNDGFVDDTKTLSIPLTSLIDTYTSSGGITCTNKNFSLSLVTKPEELVVSAAASASKSRCYNVSLDTNNKVMVYLPWVDTSLVSADSGVLTVTPQNENIDSFNFNRNYTIKHIDSHNTYTNFGNAFSASTASGTSITVPKISTNKYGHVTSVSSDTYKITLDDGVLE